MCDFRGPYPTLVHWSHCALDGRIFLLVGAVVLVALVMRNQNVRVAPLVTAICTMPAALIRASLLTIAALGCLLAASASIDRAPLAYLDVFILGPILIAPHLLFGAVLLPLARYCLEAFGVGSAVAGMMASIPVILLAVFQLSLHE